MLFGLLATSAPEAHAKDMNGKFGIGFVQTLGGVSGFGLKYWITRDIGIELDFGLAIRDSDFAQSTAFLGAIGIYYALVQHRHVNLLVGLRGDIGFRTNPAGFNQTVKVLDAINNQEASTTLEVGATPVQFNIELPLIVEYYFSDSFSVNLAMGFVVIIVPDSGPILPSDGLLGVNVSDKVIFGIGAGGLLGSAGFTFYF